MKTSWYTKRRCVRVLAAASFAVLGACSSDGAGAESRDFAGVREAERAVEGVSPGAGGDEKAALVIANSEIPWSALQPRLSEAAGGAVLEEFVLDQQLKTQMADRGFAISAQDVSAERERLVATLQRSASADQEQAARLITGLQRSRGYGPTRFAALLERNAMLRRLVRDEVAVDPATVEREIQVKYGARKQCRLILVGTESEASRLRARVVSADGAGSFEDRFAAEARSVSIDPSGKEGGMLPPISSVDVSYAAAVRRALESLRPGDVSPVVVLDRGFALLYCVGDVPAQNAPASARAEAETELRLRQERVAMDRLAQRLINSANPTVLDASLNWAWQNRAR